jgi:hypothetical protein
MQDAIEKFVQLAIVTAENQKEHFTGPVENYISILCPAVDNVYAYFAHGFRKQGKSAAHI